MAKIKLNANQPTLFDTQPLQLPTVPLELQSLIPENPPTSGTRSIVTAERPPPLSVQLAAIAKRAVDALLPELKDCLAKSRAQAVYDLQKNSLDHMFRNIDQRRFPEQESIRTLKNKICGAGKFRLDQGWGKLITVTTELKTISDACLMLTTDRFEEFFEATAKGISETAKVNLVEHSQKGGKKRHAGWFHSMRLYRSEEAPNYALQRAMGELCNISGITGDQKITNKVQVYAFILSKDRKELVAEFKTAMEQVRKRIQMESEPPRTEPLNAAWLEPRVLHAFNH